MAANILVRDVTISPNPVQAKGKYTISVSIEELKGVAFVGNYVGSYVYISDILSNPMIHFSFAHARAFWNSASS